MKKLVLIPYHKYQQFQTLQTQNHTEKNKELAHEHSSVEPTSPQSQKTIDHTESPKLSEDIILCHISKGKRKKAESLLQYVEKSPEINWNSSGELVVNDKAIKGSHIGDLLKDSVTEYKDFEPRGLEEFYKHIGNIPLTIITNPKRRKLLQSGGSSVQGDKKDITPPPGLPEKNSKTRVLAPVKKNWKDLWKQL